MSANRASPESQASRGVAFTVSEDDFSVKLSLPDDPRFWVRVEKTPDTGTALITDFMPGAQDDATMAAALAQVLADRAGADPLLVIFHDLVPRELDPGQHRVVLNRVVQSAQTWSDAVARTLGRTVAGSDLDSYRGKARLLVEMR